MAQVIESARRAAARSVNTVMTATCWLVSCRIVEAEQAGTARAGYAEMIVGRLAIDLTSLRKGALAKPEDAITPEEEIKEPYLLEFLHLKERPRKL